MSCGSRKRAETAPLTFITTDSRCRLAQEAIKVHVLRRRHRKAGKNSHRYNGCDSGGQLHVWEPVTNEPRQLTTKVSPAELNSPVEDEPTSSHALRSSLIDDKQPPYLEHVHDPCMEKLSYQAINAPVEVLIQECMSFGTD